MLEYSTGATVEVRPQDEEKALKDAMIYRAIDLYGEISPCNGKDSLMKCFTHHRGKLLFWFNGPDRSTHCLGQNELYPFKGAIERVAA